MEIIKKIKWGKITDNTCPICIQNIREKKIKNLECNHKLHIKCFNEMISSPHFNNKCPICRTDIDLEDTIELIQPSFQFQDGDKKKCGFCQEIITLNINDPNIIKSSCSCYFHFDCIKDKKNILCINCNIQVLRKKMNPLSYNKLDDCYNKWIGPISPCRQEGCTNHSDFQRYNYCLIHGMEKATINEIILTLQYFVKFIKERKNKTKLFGKVLYLIHSNNKLLTYWGADFNDIHHYVKQIFL